jgi:hemolysin III
VDSPETGGGTPHLGLERFNTWTHAVGAVLAFCGLLALLTRALREADPAKVASLAIYGVSLVALFTASAAYHGSRGRLKAVFRRLDHLAIYLAIAGSYTPFALLTLGDTHGRVLLVVVWCLAGLGFAMEFVPRARVYSVALYLAMGWAAAPVVVPLARALTGYGFAWLLASGLLYTAGTGFFVLDRRYPAAHGVFHVFVLAGSISHFVAVWVYVA